MKWEFPIVILILAFIALVFATMDNMKHPTLTQKQMYYLNVFGIYVGDK